jgi:hypothetical protein
MKLIIKMTAIVLSFSISGCDKQDQQANASKPDVLKTQLEALDNAKQVEQILQDAAAQQREAIDKNTQSQGQ